MVEIETYKDWNGPTYLQLHDRRIWWEVNNPHLRDEDADIICQSIIEKYVDELEACYKNLRVSCLGRSGRHVCIEDTPINRRRYAAVQAKCDELTDELVRVLNNLNFIKEEE